MNRNDNNDDDDDPPPSAETINKTPPSRRARWEYAGLDEDDYDREQRLIKNVDENSMKTIHAIARDVAREVAREAFQAVGVTSRNAIAAIQETGKRREADRLARQSLS